MKRTLLGVACAALLGLFGLATSPAQAAVTCTQVNPSNSAYPFNTYSYYCGTATAANGSTMAQGVHNAGILGLGELARSGTKYYLFHSPAEYAQNFPASGGNPQPGSGEYGVTKFDTNNIPIFSAIFEQDSSGVVSPYISYHTGLATSRV